MEQDGEEKKVQNLKVKFLDGKEELSVGRSLRLLRTRYSLTIEDIARHVRGLKRDENPVQLVQDIEKDRRLPLHALYYIQAFAAAVHASTRDDAFHEVVDGIQMLDDSALDEVAKAVVEEIERRKQQKTRESLL